MSQPDGTPVRRPPRMTPGRLEAFSDGVFAIALTLLVLNLKVPARNEATSGLADYLIHQWPAYVGFLVSFLVIAIIWLNHHATIRLLAYVDHGVQVLNLLLLLTVSVLPFPTALLTEYATGVHTASDQHVAVLVYGASSALMAIAFNLLWRRVLAHPEFRRPDLSQELLNVRNRRYNLGLPAYPVITLLGLVSLPLFFAGILALAVLYLLPTPDLDE